jgi:flagellar hook-basal body complex protein FliE
MTTLPIAPIGAESLLGRLSQIQDPVAQARPAAATSFSNVLMQGIDQVNQKVIDANNAVRAFTLDDSIPVHQVTYALSQAQLSLELMMQVRTRLIDGYQQLMNMQL